MRHRNIVAATLSILLSSSTLALASDEYDETGRDSQVAGRDLTVRPWRPSQRPGYIPEDYEAATAVSLRPGPHAEIEIGAPISFEVSSGRDGFGHLYVLSASGRVQLWMENVPIEAHQSFRYPFDGMTIHATAPKGIDHVILLVTRDRIDGFRGRRTTHTPSGLNHTHAGFKRALEAKFMHMPRTRWTYAQSRVRVLDRCGRLHCSTLPGPTAGAFE